MKLAIVTDDLVQKGGQEKLLVAVSEIWPDAPIYTLVATEYWKAFYARRDIQVKTSYMQKFPFVTMLYRYYFIILSHVIGFEAFDLSGYDVVLSISSRYAHMVKTKPNTTHICFMNSPGRMFWESSSYFEHETFGLLKYIKKLARPVLKYPLSYMRVVDFVASKSVDFFIANSTNVQNKIKKYYNRASTVIYPFANSKYWVNSVNPSFAESGYFLILTRLVSWKRVDIAIKACNKLGLKLKVLGIGPDERRLRSIAGPTIEFTPTDDQTKWQLLKGCTALIHTQLEDFGIVPLEAMACGKPVIAFGKGGVLETVIPGKTGEFFYKQDADALFDILKKFDPKKYLSTDCVHQAEKFDVAIFKQKLEEFVLEKHSAG